MESSMRLLLPPCPDCDFLDLLSLQACFEHMTFRWALIRRSKPLPSYEHKKLVETLTHLGQVPEDLKAFSQWIQAEAHLAFLRDNAQSGELMYTLD